MPAPHAPGATVHAIDPGLQVWATRPMPKLAATLEREIDRLWALAQARTGGRLFNGRIFCADVITPALICGHWSEYRREVAQIARHDLYPVLGQRSLAVGGVLRCADGVVFGRRPERAIYQPGEWQLPPAGTVDGGAEGPEGRVDVLGMLFTELEEEVGLARADVRATRPLCLVEHAEGGLGSHVLDLGIAIETDLGIEAIRARHAAAADDEYGALEVVPVDGLGDFLAREAATMNLQAPVFLRHAGLL
jgi:hypothetical protein